MQYSQLTSVMLKFFDTVGFYTVVEGDHKESYWDFRYPGVHRSKVGRMVVRYQGSSWQRLGGEGRMVDLTSMCLFILLRFRRRFPWLLKKLELNKNGPSLLRYSALNRDVGLGSMGVKAVGRWLERMSVQFFIQGGVRQRGSMSVVLRTVTREVTVAVYLFLLTTSFLRLGCELQLSICHGFMRARFISYLVRSYFSFGLFRFTQEVKLPSKIVYFFMQHCRNFCNSWRSFLTRWARIGLADELLGLARLVTISCDRKVKLRICLSMGCAFGVFGGQFADSNFLYGIDHLFRCTKPNFKCFGIFDTLQCCFAGLKFKYGRIISAIRHLTSLRYFVGSGASLLRYFLLYKRNLGNHLIEDFSRIGNYGSLQTLFIRSVLLVSVTLTLIMARRERSCSNSGILRNIGVSSLWITILCLKIFRRGEWFTGIVNLTGKLRLAHCRSCEKIRILFTVYEYGKYLSCRYVTESGSENIQVSLKDLSVIFKLSMHSVLCLSVCSSRFSSRLWLKYSGSRALRFSVQPRGIALAVLMLSVQALSFTLTHHNIDLY
jgi:hypothetical protein